MEFFLDSPNVEGIRARRAGELQLLSIKIIYVEGKTNQVADLPLDDGRDYVFTAQHTGALNTGMSTTSPKAAMMLNNGGEPKALERTTNIGTIGDTDSDGWAATTWDKGASAQTAAAQRSSEIV